MENSIFSKPMLYFIAASIGFSMPAVLSYSFETYTTIPFLSNDIKMYLMALLWPSWIFFLFSQSSMFSQPLLSGLLCMMIGNIIYYIAFIKLLIEIRKVRVQRNIIKVNKLTMWVGLFISSYFVSIILSFCLGLLAHHLGL